MCSLFFLSCTSKRLSHMGERKYHPPLPPLPPPSLCSIYQRKVRGMIREKRRRKKKNEEVILIPPLLILYFTSFFPYSVLSSSSLLPYGYTSCFRERERERGSIQLWEGIHHPRWSLFDCFPSLSPSLSLSLPLSRDGERVASLTQ